MSAVDDLKALGNKAFTSKKYDQAVARYSDAIDMDGKNHTLFANRSGAYCALRNYQDAEADARKTIQLKPDWVRGYTRLAMALEGQEKWDEVVAAYEKALSLEPGNSNIEADLAKARDRRNSKAKSMDETVGQLVRPQVLGRLRYHPDVAPFFNDPSFVAIINEIKADRKNFTKYAQDPRMKVVLQALLEQGSSSAQQRPAAAPPKQAQPAKQSQPAAAPPKQAQPSAQPAKQSQPAAAPPKQAPPSAQPAKQSQPAAPPPKQAPPPGKPGEAEKELGNEAFKAGRLDEAISLYDRAIELDATNVTFYSNKATVLNKQGKQAEAIKVAQLGIEHGRSGGASGDVIARAYQKIAVSHTQLGDLDSAIDALNASLQEKNDPDVRKELKVLQDRRAKQKVKDYENPELAEKAKKDGNDAFKKGDYPTAINFYTEAIKRAPRSAALYSNRAAAYARLAEFPMAIKDCEAALAVDPGFIKAYTRKGYCHFTMKEYHKAREAYQQALKIDPKNAQALSGLQKIEAQTSQNKPEKPDEEQIRKALADPEIQRIVADPGMQQVLKDIQGNPERAVHYLSDPHFREGFEKLRAAGILHF